MMDKSRRQSMDITKPRQTTVPSRRLHLTRRHYFGVGLVAVFIAGCLAAALWYQRRNDQTILHDRYQMVDLLSGQIYFGKLQNDDGRYLTLKDVYTVQSQPASSSTSGAATDTTSQSKILKVSQQVYGPDDTMAIRADQVQFWQNLRTDSKVVKAIESSPQP
jgi:hypothetical protein